METCSSDFDYTSLIDGQIFDAGLFDVISAEQYGDRVVIYFIKNGETPLNEILRLIRVGNDLPEVCTPIRGFRFRGGDFILVRHPTP